MSREQGLRSAGMRASANGAGCRELDDMNINRAHRGDVVSREQIRTNHWEYGVRLGLFDRDVFAETTQPSCEGVTR